MKVDKVQTESVSHTNVYLFRVIGFIISRKKYQHFLTTEIVIKKK